MIQSLDTIGTSFDIQCNCEDFVLLKTQVTPVTQHFFKMFSGPQDYTRLDLKQFGGHKDEVCSLID